MKKNWFVLIVAGAVIIAIAVFYFGVISYYQEISQQTEQLREHQQKTERIISKKDEVPSQKWIQLYEARQKGLDNEIASCRNYYMEIDKTLEKWFPELMVDKNNMPSLGDFKAKYLSEKDVLIKLLKAKKLYDTPEDETGDEGKDLGFGEPTPDNLKKLQKQFWIQKALFASIMESNVVRCEKLEFPDISPSKPVSFSYGSSIQFNLTVSIQNKDIPGFIHNIMKFRGGKDTLSMCVLLGNISIVRISEEVKNILEVIEEKPVPDKDKDTYKPEQIKLPPSKLFIEGEVLDFDFPQEEPAMKDKKEKPKRPR